MAKVTSPWGPEDLAEEVWKERIFVLLFMGPVHHGTIATAKASS